MVEIQRGIKSGKYLQGNFVASRENYLEANISLQTSDEMVRSLTLILLEPKIISL